MKPSPSWGLALCGLLACGTEPPTPNPPTDAGLAADVVDVQLVTDAPPALDLVAADAGVDVLEDRAEVAAVDVPQDVQADVRVIPDGACGMCSFPNARAECSPSGACSLVGCLPGFGDCDGRNANGCETNTNEAANCGACGSACPAGARCIDGQCDVCTSGQRWCAGACRDVLTDERNCGACGNVCTGLQRCYDGMCCEVGRASCDGNAANGCEADVTSVLRCGSCTARCSTSQRCAPVTTGAGYACR